MDIEHARDDYLTSEQVALALYIESLSYLAKHESEIQLEALHVLDGNRTTSIQTMKTNGFLRACMQSDNEGVLRLAKIYPGVDVVRLADALRVEYAIRKFGGCNGK